MRDVVVIVEFLSLPLVIGILIYLVARLAIYDHKRSRKKVRPADPRAILCSNCGYDLRASHERCPECGTRVPTEADRAFARGLLLNPKALQHDWPDAAVKIRLPEPHETPAIVLRSRHWAEATLLVQQLEARGILARLESEDSRTPLRIWLVIVSSEDQIPAEGIVNHFRLRPSA